MAVAIFLHKGAAGMSLGISMQKTFGQDSKSDTFVICMMVLFACFTPLGVFLGWVIAQGEHPLLEILFSSLAAGTFLYIACSEIIVEEFSTGGRKFMKLCIYLFGIAIITSLLFLETSDGEDPAPTQADKCHTMFNDLVGGQTDLFDRAKSDGIDINSEALQTWCDADNDCKKYIQWRNSNSQNVEDCIDAKLFV